VFTSSFASNLVRVWQTLTKMLEQALEDASFGSNANLQLV
jgi:hypothetical protein